MELLLCLLAKPTIKSGERRHKLVDARRSHSSSDSESPPIEGQLDSLDATVWPGPKGIDGFAELC